MSDARLYRCWQWVSDELLEDVGRERIGELLAAQACERDGLERHGPIEVQVFDARTDTAQVNGQPLFGEGEGYPSGLPLAVFASFLAADVGDTP